MGGLKCRTSEPQVQIELAGCFLSPRSYAHAEHGQGGGRDRLGRRLGPQVDEFCQGLRAILESGEGFRQGLGVQPSDCDVLKADDGSSGAFQSDAQASGVVPVVVDHQADLVQLGLVSIGGSADRPPEHQLGAAWIEPNLDRVERIQRQAPDALRGGIAGGLKLQALLHLEAQVVAAVRAGVC